MADADAAGDTCPECGAEVPPRALFCGRCGAAVVAVVGATPPVGAATPPDVPPVPAPDGSVQPPPRGSDDDPGSDAERGAGRRARVLGVAVVLALVALAALVTGPSRDAIVVGDGVAIASGPGPTDEPRRRWAHRTTLADPLPPVVAAETVVVAGRSNDEAALVGIDRSSGRQLWATTLGADRVATLTAVDGDVVVVSSGEGPEGTTRVARIAARTGATVWPVDVAVGGRVTSATTLADGATVVSTVIVDERSRTLLVGGDGRVLLDAPGERSTASAETVAVLDRGVLRTHDATGSPVGSAEVGDEPVTALAVTGDLVLVGQGARVRALDVATGDERWAADAPTTVVGIVGTSWGATVVTTGDHLGVDRRGRTVWRRRGFPIPLVRDDDPVTLLVAPGTVTARELRVVDPGGEELLGVDVPRGDHLALGRTVALSAVGSDVDATPLDGGPGWSVSTPGPVRWLVLAGPTMVVVSDDGGRATVTVWG